MKGIPVFAVSIKIGTILLNDEDLLPGPHDFIQFFSTEFCKVFNYFAEYHKKNWLHK